MGGQSIESFCLGRSEKVRRRRWLLIWALQYGLDLNMWRWESRHSRPGKWFKKQKRKLYFSLYPQVPRILHLLPHWILIKTRLGSTVDLFCEHIRLKMFKMNSPLPSASSCISSFISCMSVSAQDITIHSVPHDWSCSWSLTPPHYISANSNPTDSTL
jgi:hypothetical protein